MSPAGGGHSGRICAARGDGGDPETAAKLTASEMRVVTKATIGEVGQAALFPSASDVVLTWNCDPTDEPSGLPASFLPCAVSASFSDVDLHRPVGRAGKTKVLLSDVTDIHSIDRLTEEVRLHKKMRLTPDGCTCGEYDGDYCFGYFLSNFCIASCIALLYCFAFFMQNIFLHFAVLHLIEHAFFTFIIKANLVTFHLKIINIHCQRKIAVRIEFSLDQSF